MASKQRLISLARETGEEIRSWNRGAVSGFSKSVQQQTLGRITRFCNIVRMIGDDEISDILIPLEQDRNMNNDIGIMSYIEDAVTAVDIFDALVEEREHLHQTGHKLAPEGLSELKGEISSLTQAVSQLAARVDNVEEMASESNRQKQANEDCVRSSPNPKRYLHPKERQSLQKMILGMAIEQYGYDPSARGSAVSQIADDLGGHGLSLDEDTIRKQLKMAAEEVLEQPIPA